MQTHIYAIYLNGSATPDYIGSHKAEPPQRSMALAWRYAHCRYIGQGAWLQADGSLMMPRQNHATRWGSKLLELSPAERLALRIDIIATVPTFDRWRCEAEAIRKHNPPYNKVLSPDAAEAARLRFNAYHRAYRVGYYASNPDKAAAKRLADKVRAKTKRDARKALKARIA